MEKAVNRIGEVKLTVRVEGDSAVYWRVGRGHGLKEAIEDLFRTPNNFSNPVQRAAAKEALSYALLVDGGKKEKPGAGEARAPRLSRTEVEEMERRAQAEEERRQDEFIAGLKADPKKPVKVQKRKVCK
jgi:hypothetical protein